MKSKTVAFASLGDASVIRSEFAFERGEEALAHRVVVAVADEGGAAVAFASGMAGIAAVFDQLPSGSVVAVPDDCYQGVAGLADAGQRRGRCIAWPWQTQRVGSGCAASPT